MIVITTFCKKDFLTYEGKEMIRQHFAVFIIGAALLAGSSFGYFQDTFDGPGLDARWTNDNSPGNPGGSDIAIVSGQAVGGGSKENLYNHLQTAIDASGEFAVEVDAQVNWAQDWGAALVVYWDATHFIVLKAPKNNMFRSEVYEGSSFAVTDSSLTYPGSEMATLRIGVNVNQSDRSWASCVCGKGSCV